MKINPARVLLGAVGLALGVLAVFALREATLSTHEPADPDSSVVLIVYARSERAEPGQTLPEMVEALVLACRLEVPSDVAGPIRNEGDGRFSTVLQPALDQTDRRQLRGCLEDWSIDHVLVDVVAFETST